MVGKPLRVAPVDVVTDRRMPCGVACLDLDGVVVVPFGQSTNAQKTACSKAVSEIVRQSERVLLTGS